MNNTFSLVFWTDLHGFSTKLELLFLEVLNPSRSTQLQVKCVLSKDKPIYITYVSNKSHICPNTLKYPID